MKDEEAIQTMTEGFNYVCNLSRMIAMLPIETWIDQLHHGENVSAIIDPTLFKNYICSKKPDILKKILYAALELKRTIQEVQPNVLEAMVEEAKHE